jgi:general secretion pathway protein G
MKKPFFSVKGFTLIELLVVMTIIAILMAIVSPRYFHSISKAEEAVLMEDLALMREALDKFNADKDKYPDTLEDLVSKKYLRVIPVDPITKSNTTWRIIPPENTDKGAVYNIKSGATGAARDGTAYADW